MLIAVAAACSSDEKVSPGNAGEASDSTFAVPTTFGLPSSTLPATTTTTDTTTDSTTTAPTSTETATTVEATTTSPAVTTVPPTDAPTTTAPPACVGGTALPAGVDTSKQIVGNVDGDAIDDVVTAYTGDDGAPHVFLQRGNGGGSEVVVSWGATGTLSNEAATISTVSISFEDFDYSLGAVTPEPLVILAIGAGQPGSAFATFLSADASPLACLQQWQLDGQPFTFAIDQRGPYFGLLCDRAAGNVYYVLRTATPTEVPGTATTLVAGETTTSPKPVVSIATTAQQIDHDGPVVTLTDLGGEIFPDDGTAKRKYGDIQDCDHPPLFP